MANLPHTVKKIITCMIPAIYYQIFYLKQYGSYALYKILASGEITT